MNWNIDQRCGPKFWFLFCRSVFLKKQFGRWCQKVENVIYGFLGGITLHRCHQDLLGLQLTEGQGVFKRKQFWGVNGHVSLRNITTVG